MSASECSPLSAARHSLQLCVQAAMISHPASQYWLGGGPCALYNGEKGGEWLCFTENIIALLNTGMPMEFPCSGNGDDHPGWKYMTWPTEALSPIWKPNCKAKSKVEKKEMVTVCLVIFLPLSLTGLHNTILSRKPQKHWNKLPLSAHVLVGSTWTEQEKLCPFKVGWLFVLCVSLIDWWPVQGVPRLLTIDSCRQV